MRKSDLDPAYGEMTPSPFTRGGKQLTRDDRAVPADRSPMSMGGKQLTKQERARSMRGTPNAMKKGNPVMKRFHR